MNDAPGDGIALAAPAYGAFWRATRRYGPAAMVAAGVVGLFAGGFDDYLTLDALRAYRMDLTAFVAAEPVWSALAFIGAFCVFVALSAPGGAALTIAGGFMFGAVCGALYSVVAASAGAVVIFLVARCATGGGLHGRAGGALDRLEAGLRANAVAYLLALRLFPLIPFVVANLAPALLGVRLAPYALTTVVGIIPGTVVFAVFGAGLGEALDAMDNFAFADVLTTEVVVAMAVLCVLSLAPIFARRRMRWL